ncbi:MAG: hypothetical protein FWD71_23795 [Oscillospiraceae bacterium]|nr:hypothetical protein [Oscillospiraceae bacterium]
MRVNIANHEGMIIWDGIYYFALSDYPHISPWELKKLLLFIDYEKQHGRQTEIVCENAEILAAVNNVIDNPETVKNALLPTKITECTQCKQHGCLTEFLCHTATIENAKKILTSGKLLSAVKAFGKNADELVSDKRNAAGDPADYFDYIMFAWGNCVGGDRLVMERELGRFPDENDLSINFAPGVRFYLRHEDIVHHPGYVFDGYHPAKVKDELVLFDYLYACIVPEKYKQEFEKLIQPEIADKIYYLPQDGLGLWDWADKVYEFIEKVKKQ